MITWNIISFLQLCGLLARYWNWTIEQNWNSSGLNMMASNPCYQRLKVILSDNIGPHWKAAHFSVKIAQLIAGSSNVTFTSAEQSLSYQEKLICFQVKAILSAHNFSFFYSFQFFFLWPENDNLMKCSLIILKLNHSCLYWNY